MKPILLFNLIWLAVISKCDGTDPSNPNEDGGLGRGETGATGETGPAGVPGERGVTGPTGLSGSQGVSGLDGANGSSGGNGECWENQPPTISSVTVTDNILVNGSYAITIKASDLDGDTLHYSIFGDGGFYYEQLDFPGQFSLDPLDSGTYTCSTLVSDGCEIAFQSFELSIPCGWLKLGPAGFSDGQARHISLFVDDYTPYLAYSDNGSAFKATVMKHTGTEWETVGLPGFSADGVNGTSLYVYNGTPYIAYVDGANSNRPSCLSEIVIYWS